MSNPRGPDADPAGTGRADNQSDVMGRGPDTQPDATAPTRVQDGEPQMRLSNMLLQLNRELQATMAAEQSAGDKPLLKVKECTVELGITWTIEGDADVKFWVLDFTGKATRENAQTITVTLDPIGTIETLTSDLHR